MCSRETCSGSRDAWCVFRGEVGFSQINADKIRRFTRIPELLQQHKPTLFGEPNK